MAGASRCLGPPAARLLLLLLSAAPATAEPDDATCAAGDAGCASAGKVEYYWANARGDTRHPSYTNLTFRPSGGKDLKASLAWKWHGPEDRYARTCLGHVVDDKKDIYLGCEDGTRKFRSADGEMLWYHRDHGCPQVPTLCEGKLITTCRGIAYALDMETGEEVWRNKVCDSQGGDTAYVMSHKGRVHFAANASTNKWGAGNRDVFALDAASGDMLWRYSPEDENWKGVWNYMPFFPGDGSVIFMDWSGGVYKLSEETGKAIWYTPPPEPYRDSFTDGGVILGPDGTSYTCVNHHEGLPGDTGAVRAYRLSDGKQLWDMTLPSACTSWPVIHKDGSWGVVPSASFVAPPLVFLLPAEYPMWLKVAIHRASLFLGKYMRWVPGFWWIPKTRQFVVAFDTATGEIIMNHELPPHERISAGGDEEGVGARFTRKIREMCLPAPMSTPTMDADGSVWVAEASGKVFRVWLDRATNTSRDEYIDMDGSASLHEGVSFAPGQVAAASCDGLYVYHE